MARKKSPDLENLEICVDRREAGRRFGALLTACAQGRGRSGCDSFPGDRGQLEEFRHVKAYNIANEQACWIGMPL